jgi:hypothetical protein
LTQILALVLAAAAGAAPALPAFDAPLNQLRREVRAFADGSVEAQMKKIDGNIRLTANQCYQLRGRLASLRAEAQRQRPGQNDPSLFGQLSNLVSNMDVTADNSEVVRKQVEALLASAKKDPALAALAEKIYKDSRQLDSDAGWLLNEAYYARVDFNIAGYPNQGYQLEGLSRYIAKRTPDIRENAKKILDKIK